MVSSTNPYGRILGFLDRSRYDFFQVAPQLYSRGWVDPVPDPLLFFVVPGIEPGASGSVARNSLYGFASWTNYLSAFLQAIWKTPSGIRNHSEMLINVSILWTFDTLLYVSTLGQIFDTSESYWAEGEAPEVSQLMRRKLLEIYKTPWFITRELFALGLHMCPCGTKSDHPPLQILYAFIR
jgi:hypothetical protein